MFINKAVFDSNHYNRCFGTDGNFRLNPVMDVNAYVAKTATPGISAASSSTTALRRNGATTSASSSSTNRSSEVTAVPLPRPLPIPGSHRTLTFIQNRRP